MTLPPLEPRWIAAACALWMLLALIAACRWASRRCRRPLLLWGVGGYYMLLLAVLVYGFTTGTRFETALGQLTLLTFPFSIATDHTLYQQGFGSLPEIAHNFVRYVLLYGGLDGAILSGFFWLVSAPRTLPPPTRNR